MLKRIIADNAQGPGLFVVALFTLALATAFTLFYFLHEQLPRSVRAPSALLLAPVAIVDALCYAAGIPGIYGKALPIFIVNFVFAGGLCGLVYLIRRLGPTTPTSILPVRLLRSVSVARSGLRTLSVGW